MGSQELSYKSIASDTARFRISLLLYNTSHWPCPPHAVVGNSLRRLR